MKWYIQKVNDIFKNLKEKNSKKEKKLVKKKL